MKPAFIVILLLSLSCGSNENVPDDYLKVGIILQVDFDNGFVQLDSRYRKINSYGFVFGFNDSKRIPMEIQEQNGLLKCYPVNSMDIYKMKPGMYVYVRNDFYMDYSKIRSDIARFNFDNGENIKYYNKIKKGILKDWFPPKKNDASPVQNYTVKVDCLVTRAGNLEDVRNAESCGNILLDDSFVYAVKKFNDFDALPSNVVGKHILIPITFEISY
jgi:TonB family protein